ncbi:MAG: hypothetical protein WBB46_11675, partial [Candidatus Deferrimicrobiaceae bacterium]
MVINKEGLFSNRINQDKGWGHIGPVLLFQPKGGCSVELPLPTLFAWRIRLNRCGGSPGTSRPFLDRYDPATHIIAMPKAGRKEQDGGFIKNETRGTMKP